MRLDLFPPCAGGVERSPQPGTGKAGAIGESASQSETGGKQVASVRRSPRLGAWTGLLADAARIPQVPWPSLPTSQEPIQLPAVEEEVSDRPDRFELAPADQPPHSDLRDTQVRGGVP